MRRTLSVLGASLLFCLATAGTAAAGLDSGQLFNQTQTSGQSQSGSNSVSQDASSTAVSAPLGQVSLNAPIRILSDGSNGSVTQSNDSSATSSASNDSKAIQIVDQGQDSSQTQDGEQTAGCCATGGSGSPSFDQSQDSSQSQSGSNAVSQNADSKAISKPGPQVNVNVPIRIVSDGNDGSVTQSNGSSATSSASNDSKAIQIVDQGQSSTQSQTGEQSVGCCGKGGPPEKPCRCGGKPKGEKPSCGCKEHSPVFEQGQTSSQSQSGSNSVSQDASSKAISKPGLQVNLDAPVRVLDDSTCGCEHRKSKGEGKSKGGKRPCGCVYGGGKNTGGDVSQSNVSTADSSASNRSWAARGVDQSQASQQGQNGLQRL